MGVITTIKEIFGDTLGTKSVKFKTLAKGSSFTPRVISYFFEGRFYIVWGVFYIRPASPKLDLGLADKIRPGSNTHTNTAWKIQLKHAMECNTDT